jgi:hypothetical protein
MKGKYERTEETKKKQSSSMKGKYLGRKLDEKWKSNLGESISKSKRIDPVLKVCPECNKQWTAFLYKERKSKYCCKECYYSSKKGIPLPIDASNIDKSYMQTEEYRKTLMKDETPEYKKYRNRVSKLSELTYCENIDIINPNNHPRTLCGIADGYQLDHIRSVKECFLSGISPEVCSKIENLQMLPWKDNLLKR